jgi:IPT/TIG domain
MVWVGYQYNVFLQGLFSGRKTSEGEDNVGTNLTFVILIIYSLKTQPNRMKKNKMRLLIGGITTMLTLFILISLPGCKKNDSPPAPPVSPVINNFSPVKGAVGTTIIVTGMHFDTIPANNLVKFNGVTATVSQATATQLTVKVPVGAASGKVTATVNSLMATSATDFTVPLPLKLSGAHGITNQLIYLTQGNGFGTVPDSNGFAIYASGLGHFSTILGYNADTLVLLVPYTVPGAYTDSARVDGIMVAMDGFTVDTPALTQFGIVGNISPGSAAKGATATIPVINGSTVAGSITVALVAIYQHTGTPVSLNCTVNSRTAGSFGTTIVSFVIPDGVVTNTSYAIKVTYNGVTGYGGLNQWFTAQ